MVKFLSKLLVLGLLLLCPLTVSAQIAFDTATDGTDNGGTTSTLSWSHTATGSNLIGFVGLAGDVITGNDDITSVTWGGNAMTLIAKLTAQVGGVDPRFRYLYYILAPATGSQTITVTAGSNHYLLAGAVTYTGAQQSGQPDASTTQVSGTSTATTLTTMLTTVADNSWVVLFEYGNDSSTMSPSAGTGSTLRVNNAAFGIWGLFDSNGAVTPAGSYSMETTRMMTSSEGISHIMASFAPATGGGAARQPCCLLGVF